MSNPHGTLEHITDDQLNNAIDAVERDIVWLRQRTKQKADGIAAVNSTIRKAFCDVIGGTTAEELHAFTGLPMARCQEIYALWLEYHDIPELKNEP